MTAREIRQLTLIDTLTTDRDKWKAMALELEEVVEGLKTGGSKHGCFCEMAIGNPMYSSHSDKCKKSLNALTKLKELEE